jgi:mono/diheme cytochrome c family protein
MGDRTPAPRRVAHLLGPLWAVAAAVALLTAACGSGTGQASASDARSGAFLFANNCARCHGQNGTGGTAPTLNSKEFLTKADDLTIKNTVKVGLAGTQMPAWGRDFGGPFSDKQVNEILAYLRSLTPNAPSVPNWRAGNPSGTSTTAGPSVGASSTTSSSTP